MRSKSWFAVGIVFAMAVFAVMGALPLLRQEVCGGDHRSPPLENLGSGEYCVKGGSSESKGCDGYLATGSYDQVKAVVEADGACGLSHWSFDDDDEETPRPTKTRRPTKTPRPSKTPESTDTPVPPTNTPSATPDPTFTPESTATKIPPSRTPNPTDTPTSNPSDTPRPSVTPKSSDTPKPDPSDTPKPHPTNTPKPNPTDTPRPPTPTKPTQRPTASATLPPVTSTTTPQLATPPTETASATPYVCVVCCVCGTQTPIVVEVNVEAPDFSPIAEELKPIFYTLVAIFVALGGNLILGVYNSFKK